MEKSYYDKNGKEIREFSLLKMYHFTGARRKRYYMYKWVKIKKYAEGEEYYVCNHLNGTEQWFSLRSIANPETRIIESCEVIQEVTDEN